MISGNVGASVMLKMQNKSVKMMHLKCFKNVYEALQTKGSL